MISEAFKDLLKAGRASTTCTSSASTNFVSPQKNRIRPDGTILHDLRVPLGYWEAKDTDDDLDAEIGKKLGKGYPQDNIIFEDSRTAVLIQNRQEVMRCAMTDDAALLESCSTLFFGYERAGDRRVPQGGAAVQDRPAGGARGAAREDRRRPSATTPPSRQRPTKFLEHAKETINPTLGEADVREMLIQHILTEEIFANVFDDSDFHRENNIAKELYALEGTFFTGAVKQDTLKALEPYYAAIRANAALITSHPRSRPSSRSSTRTSTRSTTRRPPTGSASSTRRTRSCAS